MTNLLSGGPRGPRTLLMVGVVAAALGAGCGDDAGTSAGGGEGDTTGSAGGQGPGGADGSGGASQTGAGQTGAQTGVGQTGTGQTSGASTGAGASGGGGPATFLDAYPLLARFPEGGTYDAVDHTFYVGSLGDGTVNRVDAETGAEEVLFEESAPGVWWTLGMAVDEERRRLWVCAMEDRRPFDEDPAYDGYVWLLDLDTGTREAVFPLSDAWPEGTCTDVAVRESDGTAYVTDRDFGNVYEVTAEQGASLFVTDSELTASVIGQNAVVVLPDESALMIAIYLPPRLVRVDLVSGIAVDADIDGNFFDSATAAGADGMTFHDGSIYVAFTSELVRIDPVLADWTSLSATEVDVPYGMTDVVATPNGLYLLNGQAVAFAFGGDVDPFALTRFAGAL